MSYKLKALSTATVTSQSAPAAPRRALWGLLDRKERWSLSWRGWLVLASTLLLAGAFLLRIVYPFLATTHRVDTDVLVVEGWVHEYAIRAAVEEFRRGSYQRVLTTGGPVQGSGRYINDYQTAASVGADLLRKNGLPNESLQMVPSRVMDHDRTYGSAIALQNWFREQNMAVSGINVVTEDLHARRTRLLFKKALGKNVAVGIIAVTNPDYDARHWWRYSDGVRELIGETIAYIYARFFFYPSVSSSDKDGAHAASASHSYRRRKIAVVGLGYLGLPLAMQFARAAVTVVGLDVVYRSRPHDLALA